MTAPAQPSVHIRALVTWLTIYPLVAIGMYAIAPFAGPWPLPVRALVLTIVIVPLAVYLIVPQLLRGYLALSRAVRSGRHGVVGRRPLR